MNGKEGLILQGCGGEVKDWVDGINEMLKKDGILLDDTKFLANLDKGCDGTIEVLTLMTG